MGGSTTDVELQAEDVRHTRDTVLGITSEDTGQPLERVFEDSLHDHWYSADEAKEYGFIGSGVANSVIAQLLFLESSQSGRGYQLLYQLPGWGSERYARDLRHDELHPP